LEEGSSDKATGRTFRKKVLPVEQKILPVKLPEQGSSGEATGIETSFSGTTKRSTGRTWSDSFSERTFFWCNKTFYRRKVLSVKLPKELVPVASPEENSFGITKRSTERRFFREKE